MARLAGILSLAAIVLIGPAAMAHVETRRAEAPAPCSREDTDVRGFLDCLNGRLKASEAALERAVEGTRRAIEAREDLQPAQRKRWGALFEESQSRFGQWRNFECQGIAPFEGGGAQRTIGGRLGGIGVMEGRMTCLTNHNEARAADLAARYAPPQGWPMPAAVDASDTAVSPPAAAEPAAAPPLGAVRIIAP
ncbi:lysozyme inhibitor LprI family protein [Ancylobacter sp. TS-1]|uniref:lysozyme inhibitor LprI family protein n=1 Tax=Ancylobacter sp. TS-1 TaxID=1850374 RepID=UPI001265B8BF|nr:lysozyme inhibitor LprI family protein [Ancylobacter sp. TS-1]QFR33222.1 DUF1311 domain-containing protein [Ancylobacter sp. TS-1]